MIHIQGGTNITDYQLQSGAKIALSRAHEVFPGTNDRVLAVSGELEKVVFAVRTIYSNRRPAPEDEDAEDELDGVSLRLVLPRQVCGAVIGKSGATIREIVENTNANLKMSPQEPSIMVSRFPPLYNHCFFLKVYSVMGYKCSTGRVQCSYLKVSF